MNKQPPAQATPVPAADLLEQLNLPSARRPLGESLRDVTVDSEIIQEFRPLAASLEWELADVFWSTDGLEPFVRNEVPHVVNNSGRTSEDAAAILYANCLGSAPVEDRINVAELGAGTGLFARYFLDAFRAICQQEGQDFYGRLTFFVSDRSARTVDQWKERRVFEEHAEHVITGTCDAVEPTGIRTASGEILEFEDLRAVFGNYLLDVLPVAIVRSGPGGTEQLCVRTRLAKHRSPFEISRLTTAEARDLANCDDPASRVKLVPLLTLLDFETKFLPVTDDAPPFLEEVLAFGEGLDRIVLNYGAIACLEKCLRRLRQDGFILLNDYGPIKREQTVEHATTQRFGSSTATGVSFPFLEHYFSTAGYFILKPEADDDRPIHTRLLCRSDPPQTRDAFLNRFGAAAYEYFQSPVAEAQCHIQAGRNEEALESYRTALERSPRDWHVIGQAAEFVGLQLGQFEAGLELIRAAIELNPCFSPWLWNVLGDCLFSLERFDEAHEAYLQAERIDPSDVRTNLNLSYTYFQQGSYDESLKAIADGLATDKAGVFRDRLLEKQQQVLAAVTGQSIVEQQRLAKRQLAFG